MTTRDDEVRSQNLYISLREAERRVRAEYKKVGVKKYLSDPKLQKSRELWVAVGYGSLIKKLVGKDVFLRMPPPEQEPPDAIIMFHEPKDGKSYAQVSVEITEADPFSYKSSGLSSSEFILGRINKKVASALGGDYPKDMQLLVYCNIDTRLDLTMIRKALSMSKPVFSQVWLLGADDKGPAQVSLWELWPGDLDVSMSVPLLR